MDIIAITILGFIIAFFMLYWFNRHLKSARLLMENNRDVVPLFRQKSAELKYMSLKEWLGHDDNNLQMLEQLHQQYTDEQIDVDAYHNALSEMEQKHITH